METLIIVNLILLLWVAYSVSSKLNKVIKGQEVLYKDVQKLQDTVDFAKEDIIANIPG